MAKKAAQTLLERLAGKHPPLIYDQLQGVNRHTYNDPALQRFGLPVSTLPENALLLNRPLPYFEAHRSAILSAQTDVYDALFMGRVYKQPWPTDRVLHFIRQKRGGMFDPTIVDLFFASLEAIRLRLSDPISSADGDEITKPVHCPMRER